jgi:hypothetical protein
MNEAEALERAQADCLLQPRGSQRRLMQEITRLRRGDGRLLARSKRTLKAGAAAVAAFGGTLFGLLLSVALRRR